MGWSSGTDVMLGLITILYKTCSPKTRFEVYTYMIKVLRDQDWDTETECLGKDPVFDVALSELRSI